jgi:hypothetical protein
MRQLRLFASRGYTNVLREYLDDAVRTDYSHDELHLMDKVNLVRFVHFIYI